MTERWYIGKPDNTPKTLEQLKEENEHLQEQVRNLCSQVITCCKWRTEDRTEVSKAVDELERQQGNMISVEKLKDKLNLHVRQVR